MLGAQTQHLGSWSYRQVVPGPWSLKQALSHSPALHSGCPRTHQPQFPRLAIQLQLTEVLTSLRGCLISGNDPAFLGFWFKQHTISYTLPSDLLKNNIHLPPLSYWSMMHADSAFQDWQSGNLAESISSVDLMTHPLPSLFLFLFKSQLTRICFICFSIIWMIQAEQKNCEIHIKMYLL